MSRKTFADLEFHPRGMMGGIQALMTFPNGFGVSVVQSSYTYGGNQGLYELAVMKDGHICYTTSITDDVEGYLDESKVTDLMARVQELDVEP